MDLKIIAIVIGIFFCSEIAALQPAWSIQPTICIAQKPGDSCELTFDITFTDLPDEFLCLYVNTQKHTCASRSEFPRKVTVTIDKKSTVELKSAALNTLLSENLLIKYQQSNNQRRRVRPPWSLF